ncbi:hypothetical protein E2C01_055236 [Portunus trituberculatus]|uniref:Uncharacterized protein n=1 Tax=Portunus trituberculatus TaxID=210409 RepID=A0A5B7GQM9_PORTR|nr:hypothetical protein [Portunus trituberculatus]
METPRSRNASMKKKVVMAQCIMHHNLLTALAIQCVYPAPKPPKKRRVWVWPYLQKHLQYGHYDTLMDELYSENSDLYRNYIRRRQSDWLEQIAASFVTGGRNAGAAIYIRHQSERRFLRAMQSGMCEWHKF